MAMRQYSKVVMKLSSQSALNTARIQTRHRIYSRDKDGKMRSDHDRISELHKQTPQEWQDLCAARKKHPWRTFWAPGGDPSENIMGSSALYFLPIGILVSGTVVLNYLTAKREQEQEEAKKK